MSQSSKSNTPSRSKPFTVGLVQMRCTPDPDANVDRARGYLNAVAVTNRFRAGDAATLDIRMT